MSLHPPAISAGLGPEVIDRLAAALEAVSSLVARVPADRPSRCAGWTCGQVVDHLQAVTVRFGRFAGGMDPPAGFEPVGRWALAAWRADPAGLDRSCDLPFGRFDGATAAGINLFDAVVHHWDISGRLPSRPVLIETALSVARLLVTDQQRVSGQYGPEIRLPDSAPAGARLLALTGRSTF